MPEGGEVLFDLAVVELARSHAPGAIETLAEIMSNQEAPPAARVAAANALLDRGWGKPKETVETTVRTTLEDLVMASYRGGVGADGH